MDVCELLRTHHEGMLQHADEMADTADPVAAKDAYRALRDVVNRHARAAQAVVYDTLKHLDDDASATQGLKAEIELGICEDLLAQMARGNADSRAWRAKADVVRGLLRRHVHGEHQLLVPLLRQQFTDAQREALGRRFDKRNTALLAA